MEPRIEAVLAEYEAREAAENEMIRSGGRVQRDDLLIPIGRDVGGLLNLLIKGHGCRNILEVGTSYGNSAVWLSEAARANGGKVTTLELAGYKVDYARGMLAKAGLADTVEFMIGDALESIASLEGPFDFVLIDLWKELYIPVFDAVRPKLAKGAIIAADNMLKPAMSLEDATAYRRYVRACPGMDTLLLDIGSGVELSRYQTAP
jgi:predicted O-methyltransferase YrrM